MKILYSCFSPIATLALIVALTGCEGKGSGNANALSVVSISPSPAYLNAGRVGEVRFSASGGSSNYQWSLSDASLGTLSPGSNTAVYRSQAIMGTNTVTVVDALNTTNFASALILQQYPSGGAYSY